MNINKGNSYADMGNQLTEQIRNLEKYINLNAQKIIVKGDVIREKSF